MPSKGGLVINYISRVYIDIPSDMLKNNQGDQISMWEFSREYFVSTIYKTDTTKIIYTMNNKVSFMSIIKVKCFNHLLSDPFALGIVSL